MYTKNTKKKIENMPLQERIAYGYKKVIMLMLISGLLSIIAIGVLLSSLLNYVQKINASDIAVKMCRVNVNAAARNIREMALDDDEASYDDYEKTITNLLADVDSQLKIYRICYSIIRLGRHKHIHYRGNTTGTEPKRCRGYPYQMYPCIE